MGHNSPPARPRLGLVLGAGGLKGAASVGLLRALEREGIAIDMVVGCSAGSIFGAGVALGWNAERLEDISLHLAAGLFNKHDYAALGRAALTQFFPFDERFALIDDRKANATLKSLFGEQTFADTRLPLHLVATDMHGGDRVVLSQGLIREAVRASVAIPLLLRPVQVNGRLLVDGAASDPLPIDVAIREDCQIIVAMGFLGELSPRVTSLMGLIDQTTTIITRNLLKSEFAFYSSVHDSEIVPVMVNFDRPVGLNDSALIPYIIEQGVKATEKQMPYLRRLLAAA